VPLEQARAIARRIATNADVSEGEVGDLVTPLPDLPGVRPGEGSAALSVPAGARAGEDEPRGAASAAAAAPAAPAVPAAAAAPAAPAAPAPAPAPAPSAGSLDAASIVASAGMSELD
jgi:hypothetical protein